LQNPAREASCPLRGHCAVAGAVPRADFLCRHASGYSFVAHSAETLRAIRLARSDASTADAL